MKLRVLDLFSGIGGFSLGLERTGGFETAAFCEYDEFPRKVLAKHWPNVPIYPDVRELTAERIHADGLGRIDLICGGYPCQPFSHAGKRLGAEDDRHLWPEMCRIVASLRPAWVIGENVAGHVSMGLDDVLFDLDGLGYAAQAFVIPACAVNAPHRRDRLWIVAHAESIGYGKGREERNLYQEDGRPIRVRGPVLGSASEQSADMADICEDVAHSESVRRRKGEQDAGGGQTGIAPREEYGFGNGRQIVANAIGIGRCGWDSERQDAIHAYSRGKTVAAKGDGSWWAVEPAVGRVAHGVPNRVDRLKALGNAVVPQIPEMIGHAILQSMREAA